MSKVKIEKISYKGWDNCIQLSNEIIDAVITTDVGPRIIKFSLSGKDNVFCEVKDEMGKTGSNEWRIYGGHRLWQSPELEGRTDYHDNEPVEWKQKKNTVKLKAPVEKDVNI
ncbi:MAG TPA: hypothetical protein VF941_15055, partial [Clostridia bacterium]